MTALDVQVGGDHYKTMAIQPVEFSLANGLGFCEGNVIKYVCRYSCKDGLRDLRKADHYLMLVQESEEYVSFRQKHRQPYGLAGIGSTTFSNANALPKAAAGVVYHVWMWNATGNPADLNAARRWLAELVEEVAGG